MKKVVFSLYILDVYSIIRCCVGWLCRFGCGEGKDPQGRARDMMQYILSALCGRAVFVWKTEEGEPKWQIISP